jgi:hypothetical protein
MYFWKRSLKLIVASFLTHLIGRNVVLGPWFPKIVKSNQWKSYEDSERQHLMLLKDRGMVGLLARTAEMCGMKKSPRAREVFTGFASPI